MNHATEFPPSVADFVGLSSIRRTAKRVLFFFGIRPTCGACGRRVQSAEWITIEREPFCSVECWLNGIEPDVAAIRVAIESMDDDEPLFI